MSAKNENLSTSSRHDKKTSCEHDDINLVQQSLDQLYQNLMKIEVECEDQLEDNMDEFERTLSTIIDNFLQVLAEEMALCREVANEYNEQLSNHCFHLLENASLDSIGIEVTLQLRKIFKDKDALMEALADCQAERTNSIDVKTDIIHDQCLRWFENIIEGFRKTQIIDRKNNRVLEIHNYIEDQRKELALSIESTT
nr:leucine rich repeat containing protein 48 [Hymenolepis microstoma]